MRSKSAVSTRNSRKAGKKKTNEPVFSKDITAIPRLFDLAKQRLARFYQVNLLYQQLPNTNSAGFIQAEIVILSSDMRAMFWSGVEPGSPKQRFIMPNVQQAATEDFYPMYGSTAFECAMKMGYFAVSSIRSGDVGQLCFFKKPTEILLIRFEDCFTAFRWFQMVIIALGLYNIAQGFSLLNNISEKKQNLRAYLEDKTGPGNDTRYVVNISEKDDGLQDAKYLYKILSVASLKEKVLTENEFVLPYSTEVCDRQKIDEWEALISNEFPDFTIEGKAILHEFFLSLRYNWSFRLSQAPFPLFSDANSTLQRSETLTRAFICRKKLIQLSKKTKKEDLIRDCEVAKAECYKSKSPFEEFVSVSEAFRSALVLRTFLIAYSVTCLQAEGEEEEKGT